MMKLVNVTVANGIGVAQLTHEESLTGLTAKYDLTTRNLLALNPIDDSDYYMANALMNDAATKAEIISLLKTIK